MKKCSPITAKVSGNAHKAPANQEVTIDAAGKVRGNFTNVGKKSK
jgi:hypothetical protein